MIQILDSSFPIDSSQLKKSQEALQQLLSRQDLGFFKVPERAHLWSQSQEKGKELSQKADDLVVVGIGGSSLGPKALYDVLEDPCAEKRLHFCDNVDAVEFERMWSRLIDPSRTAWVFISKSGGTIETLVAADLILQRYEKHKWTFNATVVSENKSNPLTDWAKAKKLSVLEIPLDVGGRFSVLTPVGMLPMAFLGQSVAEFRDGAQQALKDQQLMSQLIAHFAQSFQRQEWITFFFFYSSSYENFGRWIQQLWAESLAKSVDRKNAAAPRVSTPMWGIGSSDQHSVLQQLMEGAKDKLIVFSRFKNVESPKEKVEKSQFPGQEFFNGLTMGHLIAAQAQGTRQALNEQKAPTMSLMVEDQSPKSLGYQMMMWQLVVGGLGEYLNINAFDQPGVELGKRLAKSILKS